MENNILDFLIKRGEKCEDCKKNKPSIIKFMDYNQMNLKRDNILLLCHSCNNVETEMTQIGTI